jgi:hypothetical protein
MIAAAIGALIAAAIVRQYGWAGLGWTMALCWLAAIAGLLGYGL